MFGICVFSVQIRALAFIFIEVINMVGIYKITNLINGHSYIGQSVNIEQRWKNHRVASNNPNDRGYEYPLYRAMRKYGQDSFSFEVLEECSQEILNEREVWWIEKLKPVYNQTAGGKQTITWKKLTPSQVQQIQTILINDKEGQISHIKLANQYNVHPSTIQGINAGRSWFNEKLTYPLHYSKFTPNNPNPTSKYRCCDCGIKISKNSIRCNKCEAKHRTKEVPISREKLKELIRTTPFTKIGEQFNVSDNAIRKWCDKYNLPRKAREIKQISEQEWIKI